MVKKRIALISNPHSARPRYDQRVLGQGICVSNDTRNTGLNNNDLIIGSSGSSKTGSIVYTQLKTLRDSSLIVADTKGQLHRMFRKELENKGFKVRTLDFVNPWQSCVYNPLDYVRKTPDGAYNELDIMKISKALISDNLYGKDPFWAISGRALLEFFLSYTLSALPETDHNMYTVCRLFRAFTKELGECGFLSWLKQNPSSFAAKRYAQIKSMQAADKMTASFYGFVNVALYPFDVEILRHIFDPHIYDSNEEETDSEDDDELPFEDAYYEDYDYEDEEYYENEAESCDQADVPVTEKLDISSIGRERTVIFLNISDVDHSIDNLVNLFYTQAFQVLVADADKQPDGRLKVPVRIIMDDFASGALIPDFDKLISVVRSRDIWLTLCIQSLSQLESLYSHNQALTVMNNCDHIVYLGSNDLGSAEFIGTRAGKTPETILRMSRTKEYYIEGGKTAVQVDKIPSYSYDDNKYRDDHNREVEILSPTVPTPITKF